MRLSLPGSNALEAALDDQKQTLPVGCPEEEHGPFARAVSMWAGAIELETRNLAQHPSTPSASTVRNLKARVTAKITPWVL